MLINSHISYILFKIKFFFFLKEFLLPTEKKCYPYEDTKPDIQPVETNIFTTFTDPMLSLKLRFPYDDYNGSNKILDMFREYKNQANSYFLANYLISIIESLIHFNYVFLKAAICLPKDERYRKLGNFS